MQYVNIPAEDVAAALDAAQPLRARQHSTPPASMVWQALIDAPCVSDEAVRAMLADRGCPVSRQWIGVKRTEIISTLGRVCEILGADHGPVAAGLAVVEVASTIEKAAARRFPFTAALHLDPERSDVWLEVIAAADGCYRISDIIREVGWAVVIAHGAVVDAAEAADLVRGGHRVAVFFGPRQASLARAFAAEVAALA